MSPFDGTLYVGMTDGDDYPNIALSIDRGLNLSTPVDFGVPFDIENRAFPAVVAGEGDRAAFTFLGIDADQPGGGGDDPDAVPNGDIYPCGGGNGLVDVDDILADLDAFSGVYACPDDPCGN